MSTVEELREQNKLLKQYLVTADKLIKHQDGVIKRLYEEKAKQDQQALLISEQLDKLKKRMFGKSSEKDTSFRKREDEEEQLTIHSQSLAPPPKEIEKKQIPEVRVDRTLTSEELANIAEQYGYPRDSEWELIDGLYDESSEYDLVPKKLAKKKYRRFKYRLKVTKGSEKEIIVSAPGPSKLVPGSSYSVDFALDVVTEKYLYHNPLERIRRKFEELGLELSCKTLYSLCYFITMYLEDVYLEIKNQILSCGLSVHIDETRWPINNKYQDDGHMWVISNQGGSFYQFEPTRSGSIATELLGSYCGPVVSDGYGGYNRLRDNPNIVLGYCWFHARRQFKDIEQNYPRECKEILELIRKLFRVEKKVKTYEELKEKRTKESKPITDEIYNWLIKMKTEARAESGLLGAVDYCLKFWSGLTKFLTDPKIPLSNNEVERTIRQAVMGRKNFQGSRTINGADVASILYTVIESCKKVELNSKEYLKYAVLEKIQGREPKTPLDYAKFIRTH